jgi:hypothetical protein
VQRSTNATVADSSERDAFAATSDEFSVIGESLPHTDPYTWKVLALQQ